MEYPLAVSLWVPVISALGASLLTGTFTFGVAWLQESRRDQRASLVDKSVAYHALAAQILSFVSRAQALHTLMQFRSGIGEGLDILMRIRRPVDPMELHDWFARDFDPLCSAWSQIGLLGTQEAYGAATKLIDACSQLIETATQLGECRSKFATTILGQAWTDAQADDLNARLRNVARTREAFMRIARRELGEDDVTLPIA